ncbi:MAG: hypothetical protein BJ554DRAFT_4659, partial [Olpidium bornovanus]
QPCWPFPLPPTPKPSRRPAAAVADVIRRPNAPPAALSHRNLLPACRSASLPEISPVPTSLLSLGCRGRSRQI